MPKIKAEYIIRTEIFIKDGENMSNITYTTFGNTIKAMEPQTAEITAFLTKKIPGSGKKKGTASTAEPIRDLEVLKAMRKFFLDEAEKSDNMNKKISALRNHLLFVIGLNFGLRISDILSLTWKDLQTDKLIIREKKTGKFNIRFLTDDIKQALEKYKSVLTEYNIDPLPEEKVFDMTKQNVIKTLKRAAVKCNFTENIGTHTMRKTFAYWYLMNHKNDSRAATVLQAMFNHSDGKITMKYAGITEDENKAVFEDMGNFYADVDRGTVKTCDDKITVSYSRMEELLRYAYALGKETTDISTDFDNLETLKAMLSDLQI